MNDHVVAGLLDDMEESWSASGYLPLYELGWSLRDGAPMTDEMVQMAQRAFDEFTGRHPTQVVWTPWPIDLEQAQPLEPGTPLEFDLDPDRPVGPPLQVLVPATS